MRQLEVVELIASENFPDERVIKACGTEFMNKYAEGYPEKKSVERFKSMFPDYIHTGNIGRYYGGCDCVDMLELYTRYLFQRLFNTDYHVNVQPHSGSQANEAAYAAFIKPGDTILSMSLSNGGHLSHGLPANFSGKLYNIVEQFRKKYGIIKGVSDRPYTSNSFHCGVWEDISPIQKQDIEYPMFHLCNGGNIQYCRYTTDYNTEAMKTLIRRAMKMGFYEGINMQLDYCEDCGASFIDKDECPKCGSTNITRIERMNGYLGYSKVKGRTMYADHKLAEFAERKSM